MPNFALSIQGLIKQQKALAFRDLDLYVRPILKVLVITSSHQHLLPPPLDLILLCNAQSLNLKSNQVQIIEYYIRIYIYIIIHIFIF